MNSIVMIGNLAGNPQLKISASGTSICKFQVKHKNFKKETKYFDCVSFGKTAENIAQYFSSGSAIIVDGCIDINEWTDKDGNKRKNFQISVSKFGFVPRDYSTNEEASADTPAAAEGEDDVPF